MNFALHNGMDRLLKAKKWGRRGGLREKQENEKYGHKHTSPVRLTKAQLDARIINNDHQQDVDIYRIGNPTCCAQSTLFFIYPSSDIPYHTPVGLIQ